MSVRRFGSPAPSTSPSSRSSSSVCGTHVWSTKKWNESALPSKKTSSCSVLAPGAVGAHVTLTLATPGDEPTAGGTDPAAGST